MCLPVHIVLQVSVIRCAELRESNVNLKLTIVDTIGFGDQIDKTDRCVYCVTSENCLQ